MGRTQAHQKPTRRCLRAYTPPLQRYYSTQEEIRVHPLCDPLSRGLHTDAVEPIGQDYRISNLMPVGKSKRYVMIRSSGNLPARPRRAIGTGRDVAGLVQARMTLSHPRSRRSPCASSRGEDTCMPVKNVGGTIQHVVPRYARTWTA